MIKSDIEDIMRWYYSSNTRLAVNIIQDIILIDCQVIIDRRNNVVTGKTFILDQLAKHYQGQQIIVVATDGEDLQFSGWDNFLKWCCATLSIPHNTITYVTHPNHTIDQDLQVNQLVVDLGIFRSANRHLPIIQKDLSQAKFIGYTIGRFTMPRMRLAYELDKAFANDSYCEFSEVITNDNDNLCTWEYFADNYTEELEWFKTKQFVPQHLDWHAGLWEYSLKQYDQIWNRYCIEVVVETNSLTNYFFTEKTARCLASGKPFVLFSGRNSLKNLQKMGFHTYEYVIDESYDTALHPYQRAQMMVQALMDLYQSSNREDQIKELYHIANENVKLFKEYYE